MCLYINILEEVKNFTTNFYFLKLELRKKTVYILVNGEANSEFSMPWIRHNGCDYTVDWRRIADPQILTLGTRCTSTWGFSVTARRLYTWTKKPKTYLRWTGVALRAKRKFLPPPSSPYALSCATLFWNRKQALGMWQFRSQAPDNRFYNNRRRLLRLNMKLCLLL